MKNTKKQTSGDTTKNFPGQLGHHRVMLLNLYHIKKHGRDCKQPDRRTACIVKRAGQGRAVSLQAVECDPDINGPYNRRRQDVAEVHRAAERILHVKGEERNHLHKPDAQQPKPRKSIDFLAAYCHIEHRRKRNCDQQQVRENQADRQSRQLFEGKLSENGALERIQPDVIVPVWLAIERVEHLSYGERQETLDDRPAAAIQPRALADFKHIAERLLKQQSVPERIPEGERHTDCEEGGELPQQLPHFLPLCHLEHHGQKHRPGEKCSHAAGKLHHHSQADGQRDHKDVLHRRPVIPTDRIEGGDQEEQQHQ